MKKPGEVAKVSLGMQAFSTKAASGAGWVPDLMCSSEGSLLPLPWIIYIFMEGSEWQAGVPRGGAGQVGGETASERKGAALSAKRLINMK